LEPGSATASPFRYATLFKLVDLSCDFLLRTKDMATAEKRQTITREQIKQCLFLWDSLDATLSSLGSDGMGDIFPHRYRHALHGAYDALKSARTLGRQEKKKAKRALQPADGS